MDGTACCPTIKDLMRSFELMSAAEAKHGPAQFGRGSRQ